MHILFVYLIYIFVAQMTKTVFQACFNVFWSILIASNINLPNKDP